MGLFGPAYFSKNEAKRRAAIEKLSEKERIALFTSDLQGYGRSIYERDALRREILSYVNDQQFLASVLAGCCNGQIDNGCRPIAARRLTHPGYISAAYLAIRKPANRIAVLDMVTDPALLTAVALNRDKTRSDAEQIHAIEKLKDEKVTLLLCTDGVSPDHVHRACIPLLGSEANEAAEKLLRQWESGAGLSVGMIRFITGRMPEERLVRAIEERQNTLGNGGNGSGMYEFAAAVTDRGALIRLCTMSGGHSSILDKLQPDFDECMIILSGTKTVYEWRYVAARLSELEDERVNEYLIAHLYGRGVKKKEGYPDAELHDDAVNLLSRRTGMDETAIALRFGDADAVRYYISKLRKKIALNGSDIRMEAEILRSLYADGIGRDAMADMVGKKLRDHYDYMPPSCEGDTHSDYPEEWFNV